MGAEKIPCTITPIPAGIGQDSVAQGEVPVTIAVLPRIAGIMTVIIEQIAAALAISEETVSHHVVVLEKIPGIIDPVPAVVGQGTAVIRIFPDVSIIQVEPTHLHVGISQIKIVFSVVDGLKTGDSPATLVEVVPGFAGW